MQRVRFDWDFALDTKSLIEEDDGTLIIAGYASDFDVDRDGEFMTQGALQKALNAYMANPVLVFHHKLSELMGRVRSAHVDGKGLWIEGEVPRPQPGTERMNRYEDVKRGILRGFSVGGFFNRVRKAGKTLIDSIDLVEISLTPTPVNPRTLGTVAGKAVTDADPDGDGDNDAAEMALAQRQVAALEGIFSAITHLVHGQAEPAKQSS